MLAEAVPMLGSQSVVTCSSRLQKARDTEGIKYLEYSVLGNGTLILHEKAFVAGKCSRIYTRSYKSVILDISHFLQV